MQHHGMILAASAALLLSGCPSETRAPTRATTARPVPRRTPPPRARPKPLGTHRLWEVKTGHAQARLVAVYEGCLLVLAGNYVAHGTPQKELRCHDPATGDRRWAFTGGAAPLSFLGAHSAVVILRDVNGKPLFVDVRTGKSVDRPKGALPRPSASAPLEWQGHRYAVDGFTVRCTHIDSGKTVWEAPTRGAVAGLVRQGDVVYFAVGNERAIHARNARSGLGIWLHQVKPQPNVKHPRRVNFTFRVVKDRLYIARYDGSLAAFEIRPGGSIRPPGDPTGPRRK